VEVRQDESQEGYDVVRMRIIPPESKLLNASEILGEEVVRVEYDSEHPVKVFVHYYAFIDKQRIPVEIEVYLWLSSLHGTERAGVEARGNVVGFSTGKQ
jgi:hypothetical protein